VLQQQGLDVTACVPLNVPTRLTAIRQRSGRSTSRPLAAGNGLRLADYGGLPRSVIAGRRPGERCRLDH
jgi:hypothetical protein